MQCNAMSVMVGDFHVKWISCLLWWSRANWIGKKSVIDVDMNFRQKQGPNHWIRAHNKLIASLASSRDHPSGGETPPPRKRLRVSSLSSQSIMQSTTNGFDERNNDNDSTSNNNNTSNNTNNNSSTNELQSNGATLNGNAVNGTNDAKQEDDDEDDDVVNQTNASVCIKSRTDEDIIRLIGQHLRVLGLKYVLMHAFFQLICIWVAFELCLSCIWVSLQCDECDEHLFLQPYSGSTDRRVWMSFGPSCGCKVPEIRFAGQLGKGSNFSILNSLLFRTFAYNHFNFRLNQHYMNSSHSWILPKLYLYEKWFNFRCNKISFFVCRKWNFCCWNKNIWRI